jgi:hypothetical protein
MAEEQQETVESISGGGTGVISSKSIGSGVYDESKCVSGGIGGRWQLYIRPHAMYRR